MRVLLLAHLIGSRNFQPLALEYLSACLKAAGHETRLADASLPRSVFRRVGDFRPEVIGYSATTGIHPLLLELNAALKKRFQFFSVFGGPHATFYPPMIERDGVDAVCLGEGEEALVDLVDTLARGHAVTGLANFWVKQDGVITRNPPRPLIRDLDSLPYPDWSLTEDFPYCRDFPVKIFLASRGCPYSCAFCSMPAYRRLYAGQPFYRVRDPEKVVAEIQAYRRRRPLRFIYLFDDTFGIDEDWLVRFCEAYGRDVRIPFCVQVRADLVTDRKVALMVGAGLAHAALGLETGSEKLRFDLLEKRISDEQLLAAARVFKQHRIPLMTYNLLGVPGTTLADDLQTLRFNWRMAADFADGYMFQPYPQTAFAERAKQQGLISGDPDQVPRTIKSVSAVALGDAAARIRLLYLFPILAAHPVSEKTVRTLLSLPLNPLYRLLLRLYEGYVRTFKIYRVRIPLRILLRIAWHYLRV
jgi:anaerobic magnesium-protoporphyrin IX monomethyl ester cyclase